MIFTPDIVLVFNSMGAGIILSLFYIMTYDVWR